VNEFDLTVIRFINQFVGRWPEFDRFMAFLTWQNILKGGAIATLLWWAWFSGKQRVREMVLGTLFGSFAAVAAARLLASAVHFRMRPLVNPELDFHALPGIKAAELISWSAFPSDHATLFIGIATGLCFVSLRVGIAALAYTVVVILFPRLYGGIHHPTDLIAGGLLGYAFVATACSSRWIERLSGRLLEFEKDHAATFHAALFIACFEIAELFEGVRNSAHSTLRFWARFYH
jgi:undecaprenyl-diphosphatase